jgi:predicted DNA-binding transcriptional regulator AlpA
MSSRFSSSSLSPELQQHRYLTEQEVAALTGRAIQTLRNDRHRGRGFPYCKIGRSVRYSLSEIITTMESRRIETEGI